MLSSTSSRVRPSGCAVEDARDQRQAASRRGRASRRPGRQVNPRSRTASAGGSPSRGRRRRLSQKKPSAARSGGLLLGGEPGRRRAAGRRPPRRRRRGTAPGMLVWMPSSSGGACTPIRSTTSAPQSPPCGDVARVAEALHQLGPGARDALGVPAGRRSACRRTRSPASTGSPGGTRPTRSPPCAVGLVSGSMIFSCSMTEPGHPCVTMQRQRVLVLRADVDEVDVQPVDLGDEVRQGVQSAPRTCASRTRSPSSARAPASSRAGTPCD